MASIELGTSRNVLRLATTGNGISLSAPGNNLRLTANNAALNLAATTNSISLSAESPQLRLSTTGPTLKLGVETGMAVVFPQYQLLLDEVGTLTYVGEAAPGSATSAAVWRIFRLDETGSGDEELIKKFASGSTNFDQIWDNRLALSYS